MKGEEREKCGPREVNWFGAKFLVPPLGAPFGEYYEKESLASQGGGADHAAIDLKGWKGR